MNSREESWLVPFFLENMKSGEIGFGCGIIILLAFVIILRKTIGWSSLLVALFIYGISLGTGIGINEAGFIKDRGSAAIAGIWAPLVYSVIIGLFIQKTSVLSQNRKSDIDHLIE